MLVEYVCANYGIIGESVHFPLYAGTDSKTEPDLNHTNNIYSYKKSEQVRFYPTTVLFGNNGSGKSVLVESMATMQQIVTNDINRSQKIFVPNYGNTKKGTLFSVNLLVRGVWYHYEFTIKNGAIEEEQLCVGITGKDKKNRFVIKNRGKTIYTRKQNKVTFGKSFKKTVFKEALSLMKPNVPLLTCASKTVKECKDVYQFFAKSLMIVKDREMYALKTLKENEDIKQIVLNALNDLCYRITDIRVDDGSKRFEHTSKNLLKEYGYNVELSKKGGKTPYTATIIKDKCSVAFHNESDGLKSLICIMTQIAEAILREKVLVYDDIDTHLHTLIVKDIVEFTTELYANPNQKKHPQFIFTTHCLPVMDLDILRKDQIWFTEYEIKQNKFSLFSLAEFKDTERMGVNMYRRYMNGIFGCVPVGGLESILNPTFE